MSNLDKVKQQIRAIFSKSAEGSGATEAEADNALRFARRMMLKNNLTEEDCAVPKYEHETAADAEAVEYGKGSAYTSGVNLTQWEGVL